MPNPRARVLALPNRCSLRGTAQRAVRQVPRRTSRYLPPRDGGSKGRPVNGPPPPSGLLHVSRPRHIHRVIGYELGFARRNTLPRPMHRSSASWASGASRRFRRLQVNVEEFEPEVLDSPQEAVQGRLVGSGAPQHCRIARRAHRHVAEDCPHPGTRDTANGDHVCATGHLPCLIMPLANRRTGCVAHTRSGCAGRPLPGLG